jgi:hypothetical protein
MQGQKSTQKKILQYIILGMIQLTAIVKYRLNRIPIRPVVQSFESKSICTSTKSKNIKAWWLESMLKASASIRQYHGFSFPPKYIHTYIHTFTAKRF